MNCGPGDSRVLCEAGCRLRRGGGWWGLLGSGDKFSELAFDIGAAAHKNGGKNTVGIDGEVTRDGGDVELPAKRVVGIAVLHPGHPVLADEVTPLPVV